MRPHVNLRHLLTYSNRNKLRHLLLFDSAYDKNSKMAQRIVKYYLNLYESREPKEMDDDVRKKVVFYVNLSESRKRSER